MSRRRLALLLVMLALLALWFFPALVTLITDWWFFREIGYQVVYTREIETRTLLFFLVGGFAAAWLYGNLRMAQRGLAPVPFHVPLGGGAAGLVNLTALVRRVTLPFALVLGLMIGLGASASWDMVLQVTHGSKFGIADPIFSRDIGYYVFTLPGIDALVGMLRGLAVTALVLILPVYWVRGDIVLAPPRRLIIEPGTNKHLAGLVMIVFALTAIRLWFVDHSKPGLLHDRTARRRELHRPACDVADVAALGGRRAGCSRAWCSPAVFAAISSATPPGPLWGIWSCCWSVGDSFRW